MKVEIHFIAIQVKDGGFRTTFPHVSLQFHTRPDHVKSVVSWQHLQSNTDHSDDWYATPAVIYSNSTATSCTGTGIALDNNEHRAA